jgi:hypothetical protein
LNTSPRRVAAAGIGLSVDPVADKVGSVDELKVHGFLCAGLNELHCNVTAGRSQAARSDAPELFSE